MTNWFAPRSPLYPIAVKEDPSITAEVGDALEGRTFQPMATTSTATNAIVAMTYLRNPDLSIRKPPQNSLLGRNRVNRIPSMMMASAVIMIQNAVTPVAARALAPAELASPVVVNEVPAPYMVDSSSPLLM